MFSKPPFNTLMCNIVECDAVPPCCTARQHLSASAQHDHLGPCRESSTSTDMRHDSVTSVTPSPSASAGSPAGAPAKGTGHAHVGSRVW